MTKVKYLSIVVPAYREQRTIATTLKNLEKRLVELGIQYEIICVVDGEGDNTYREAANIKSKHIQVFSYPENHGKGYAVRYGMERANGDVIGFMDANGINPASVSMVLQHYEWYGADIIVGSKRHPVSKVRYPWSRRVISWVYQNMIRILFGLEIRDTQVGLKLFSRKVIRELLPQLEINDFAFDIEMLALAQALGYSHIYEAPIELETSADKTTSTVFSKGLFRSALKMIRDSFNVFYRIRIRG